MRLWLVIVSFLICFRAICKEDVVTIALLQNSKPHLLPLFLATIENQTWPKNKTYLYISVPSTDVQSCRIFEQWIGEVKYQYRGIHYVQRDSDEVYVDGNIHEKAAYWAHARSSHYFELDGTAFIAPSTIELLLKPKLPIIAPLLRTGSTLFSNYHACIDAQGYYSDCLFYHHLLGQEYKGLIEVPVVHGTYLVRWEFIPKLSFVDQTTRHPYVIFSQSARNNAIPQYLDTRIIYGHISFSNDVESFSKEPWISEFRGYRSLSKIIESEMANILTV